MADRTLGHAMARRVPEPFDRGF